MRGAVQVVKKHGGENNLHYHTTSASFWMVLKGRVRFYGPDDVLIGEFGPHEGTITPRYAALLVRERRRRGRGSCRWQPLTGGKDQWPHRCGAAAL
mgnify:CR=1 FL=1